MKSFFWPFVKHAHGICLEKIGLKALGNYSASYWSYNFSICLWERPKLPMSMISGFFDVSLSPNTICSYLWRPEDTYTNPRTHRKSFLKFTILGISKCWIAYILKIVEQTGADPSNKILEILNIGSIYS